MTAPAEARVDKVGLLFVHGIGEQKRFEHLTSSAGELVLQLRAVVPGARIAITDRTEGWPLPPGEPHAEGLAPLSISLRSPTDNADFDCHEVWWADLGARHGLFDVIGFWMWGLGQWAAPIYREVDASGLDRDNQDKAKPIPSLARAPVNISGELSKEPWSRIKLLLAALAALFVALTWGLLKRLASGLLGQAPSPTLLVQYVGDVMTYTEPGSPSDATALDPGHPRRVGIRRRMVREMVALAIKPMDRWYVLAHSLGTVVAYNGLTEIGHTLPNYLSEEQWNRLPANLRTDDDCNLRRDLDGMMPGRPSWLADEHCLNRPLLFENLAGLFTYGSPLDKFAALWPRIVATATDRKDSQQSPFPAGCRWINFAAPHDPVAGMLKYYPAQEENDRLKSAVPVVENVRTPLGAQFGLAHITYLKGEERHARGVGIAQKHALARWLIDASTEFGNVERSIGQRVLVVLGYALILLLLWGLTASAVTALRAVIWAIEPGGAPSWWKAAHHFIRTAIHMAGPVLGTVLGLVTTAGFWRWWRESVQNVRLATLNRANDLRSNDSFWRIVLRMLRWQRAASFLHLVPIAAILWLGWMDWTAAWSRNDSAYLPSDFRLASFCAVAVVIAAFIQTLINRQAPSVEKWRDGKQAAP